MELGDWKGACGVSSSGKTPLESSLGGTLLRALCSLLGKEEVVVNPMGMSPPHSSLHLCFSSSQHTWLLLPLRDKLWSSLPEEIIPRDGGFSKAGWGGEHRVIKGRGSKGGTQGWGRVWKGHTRSG